MIPGGMVFNNTPGVEPPQPKASRLLTLLVVVPWAVAAALIVRYM
ncbi:hypothetical protein LCGC14_0258240 [marine sediment metagenome]|uniref:Uncharacterized protein n=1 Tax=marine sediment metagenome TaxID=412755 RepID=A0A0F9U6Z5_9ZZZZ